MFFPIFSNQQPVPPGHMEGCRCREGPWLVDSRDGAQKGECSVWENEAECSKYLGQAIPSSHQTYMAIIISALEQSMYIRP